jgi:hypothetical protein
VKPRSSTLWSRKGWIKALQEVRGCIFLSCVAYSRSWHCHLACTQRRSFMQPRADASPPERSPSPVSAGSTRLFVGRVQRTEQTVGAAGAPGADGLRCGVPENARMQLVRILRYRAFRMERDTLAGSRLVVQLQRATRTWMPVTNVGKSSSRRCIYKKHGVSSENSFATSTRLGVDAHLVVNTLHGNFHFGARAEGVCGACRCMGSLWCV